MKTTVTALFLFLSAVALHAQTQTAQGHKEERIYVIVDQMPEFKGGQDSLLEYIRVNTHNPRKNKSPRKVFVQFMIDTTGVPMHVKAVKGACTLCDEEAVRLVRSMPVWTPGTHKGHKVNVQYSVPVEFPPKSEPAEEED